MDLEDTQNRLSRWTSLTQEDLLDLQPGRDGRVCQPRHTFTHDGDDMARHTSPVFCVFADLITETNRVLNLLDLQLELHQAAGCGIDLLPMNTQSLAPVCCSLLMAVAR